MNLNIRNVSSDGFNSAQLKQNFILHGIQADYVTADGSNNPTYPTLQRVLYDGYLKLIYIPLLEKELIELDMTTIKNVIDHPLNGSKDGSDSLACAVQNLINHRMLNNDIEVNTNLVEQDLLHSFKLSDINTTPMNNIHATKTENYSANVNESNKQFVDDPMFSYTNNYNNNYNNYNNANENNSDAEYFRHG